MDVIWILVNQSQSRSFANRVTSHQFKVDYAFNTDDSNDTVYDAVARPCIDLALRVRDPLHNTLCLFFLGVKIDQYLDHILCRVGSVPS